MSTIKIEALVRLDMVPESSSWVIDSGKYGSGSSLLIAFIGIKARI